MRLQLAVQMGLPVANASALIIHPDDDFDIAPLNAPHIVTPFKPSFDNWAARGMTVFDDVPNAEYDLAIICAGKSKQQTKDAIARAMKCVKMVVVNGQKKSGINSIYNDMCEYIKQIKICTKAHGRIFWFAADGAALPLHGWLDTPQMVDGLITRAGVFSAGKIDAGSQLLLDNLPQNLHGAVADFGVGWGYLSRSILQHDGVKSLDMIEANMIALTCARENITDARANFIWADATAHKGQYDVIIMNPPFHNGRADKPELGQAFIKNAANCLKKKGQLYIVANRHLPYEGVLNTCFGAVRALDIKSGFKVYKAVQPRAYCMGNKLR